MTGRIIIADDHPLFRSALAHAVGKVWPDAAPIHSEHQRIARQVHQLGGRKETFASGQRAMNRQPCSVWLDERNFVSAAISFGEL